MTNETTNIAMMLYGLGSTKYTNYTIVNNFTLILGEDFNTSHVEDMSSLFEDLGIRSNTVNINLGNTFNTIRVENMKKMFKNCGGMTNILLWIYLIFILIQVVHMIEYLINGVIEIGQFMLKMKK